MATAWPEGLSDEVEDLLVGGPQCLVLEKVAKAAGSTRWWVVGSLDEFRRAYGELRPGSRVLVVPVGGDVRLAPFDDEVQARLFDIAVETGEVVLGTAAPGDIEYEVDVLDASEISAAVVRLRRDRNVLYGRWPRSERIRFTPADDDGEIRPQPT